MRVGKSILEEPEDGEGRGALRRRRIGGDEVCERAVCGKGDGCGRGRVLIADWWAGRRRPHKLWERRAAIQVQFIRLSR